MTKSRWLASRPLVGLSALGLAGAMVATVPAAAASAAGPHPAAHGQGAKMPAIGLHPHYQVEGHVGSRPSDVPVFTCQVTTPAGCYGPAQVRAAYGVDKVAATGAGRTIVIIDAFQSPTITHDLQTFDAIFGLKDPTLNIIAPDGLTPFDPNDDNQVGWSGEITLDVEWAHAIAPDATIDLVLSKTNDDADILSATKFAIRHRLGDTISQSFGEAEQCMPADLLKQQHALFAEAALRGITVFASSGDQGSAQPTCDGQSFFKAASTPASDPFVTGVGGTILDADGITGAYHSEQVWNEPQFQAAGGGGFSVVYGRPLYQIGQHISSRGVPDISYNAAIIGGVLAVWSSSGQGADLVFRFGGTSAGSPQWAALTAVADQMAHHSLGFINPLLYALGASRLSSSVFHDITVGDNTFHGDVTVPGFAAKKGWDAASGLGTPNGANLLGLLTRH